MTTIGVIALCVIGGVFAASWITRRLVGEKLGVELSILADVIARLAAVFFVFAASVKLAERGGVALAGAITLGILGLAMTALAGLRAGTLWYIATRGIPEE